jgi:hypothetical protein
MKRQGRSPVSIEGDMESEPSTSSGLNLGSVLAAVIALVALCAFIGLQAYSRTDGGLDAALKVAATEVLVVSGAGALGVGILSLVQRRQGRFVSSIRSDYPEAVVISVVFQGGLQRFIDALDRPAVFPSAELRGRAAFMADKSGISVWSDKGSRKMVIRVEWEEIGAVTPVAISAGLRTFNGMRIEPATGIAGSDLSFFCPLDKWRGIVMMQSMTELRHLADRLEILRNNSR